MEAFTKYELDSAVATVAEMLAVEGLSTCSREFLERLSTEAKTNIEDSKQVATYVQANDSADVTRMLEAFGTTVAALRFEEESHAFNLNLIRHFRDVPPDLVLAALPQAAECRDILPVLIRVAVEIAPQLAFADMEKMLAGDSSEAVKAGVFDANKPFFLRQVRHSLRKKEHWIELPMAANPQLTSLLVSLSSDAAG